MKLNTEQDIEKFRQWLTDLLKSEDIVEIEFKKSDGTHRVMQCTLNEGKLPPRPVKEETEGEAPKRKVNPHVISVFDIEAHEWRSFRINSIKRMTLMMLEE